MAKKKTPRKNDADRVKIIAERIDRLHWPICETKAGEKIMVKLQRSIWAALKIAEEETKNL